MNKQEKEGRKDGRRRPNKRRREGKMGGGGTEQTREEGKESVNRR